MSKADNFQNKLDKAYGIVAKNLGRSFEIYRPASLDNPLQSSNYIDEKLVSFSKDEKYKSVSKSGLSLWLTWIDASLDNLFTLKNGDMFYDSQNNETYITVGMEPLLTHQSIKANNRISITRSGSTGYGDNDGTGFAPGNIATSSTIATNVPCQILQASSYGTAGYVPTTSNAEDTIPRLEIYLWDSNNEINIRDKFTDENGIEMEVQVITQTDVGTKILARGIPQ